MNLFPFIKSLKSSLLLNAGYLLRKKTRFKSVVEKYPDVISGKAPLDMFVNYKGYLRNDLSKCTGCGICVPICPVKALDLETEHKADASIEVKKFTINLGRCFSCAVCIEACPEESLNYSKDFELVSERPEDLMMVLFGHNAKKEHDITRIRTYEVRR